MNFPGRPDLSKSLTRVWFPFCLQVLSVVQYIVWDEKCAAGLTRMLLSVGPLVSPPHPRRWCVEGRDAANWPIRQPGHTSRCSQWGSHGLIRAPPTPRRSLCSHVPLNPLPRAGGGGWAIGVRCMPFLSSVCTLLGPILAPVWALRTNPSLARV